MDEGMLDSEAAMVRFLHLIASGAGHRARADHDRLVQVDDHRSGPEVRAGQGRRELHQAFGDAGIAVTALNEDNWSCGVALEADGKIVLGGWVYEGGSSSGNFALARYTAEGELDGRLRHGRRRGRDENGRGNSLDRGMAVLLQSDERVPTVRVLVAGEAQVSDQDFAIARFWRWTRASEYFTHGSEE